jgi:hypothetical protein
MDLLMNNEEAKLFEKCGCGEAITFYYFLFAKRKSVLLGQNALNKLGKIRQG